jgi:PAS domain S-box-containing protein
MPLITENVMMDDERSRLQSRVATLEAELVRLNGEREDGFRSLANNLNVGVYRNMPGPEGRCVEANSAIVDMFGFDSKHEFLASPVVDRYQNPEDRRKFSEKMKKEGCVVNEELKLKRKDGTVFIGSVSTVAVKDESGEVLFYDGVIIDVTAQKQAQDALMESEVKFRTLFDLSPQAIAPVYMGSSSIVDINGKFGDLFKSDDARHDRRGAGRGAYANQAGASGHHMLRL